MTQQSYRKNRRSLWPNRRSFLPDTINLVGAILAGLGIPLINLSGDSLLESARRRSGLTDFGDLIWKEGFQVLIDSLEKDGQLSLLGRRGMRRECIRLLVNHLQIERDLRQHPEILENPISKPLFIVGLPRTGTTLLHNLLACDTRARVPRMWELYHPSPPPDCNTRKSDPRIEIARQRVERLLLVAPELPVIHPIHAEGPDECFHLFKNGFMSPAFLMTANVNRYLQWLYVQEMVPAYQYYSKQLQLLQWRCPGEYWILKSPSHLPFLESLLSVFPDARIIQTHRDPLKVVPSLCSLVLTGWQMSSDRVDPKEVGRRCLENLRVSVGRSIAVRESASEDHFFDLQYEDFIGDPMGCVRRIYGHLELDVSPEMEKRMGDYLSRTVRAVRGIHRYALGTFGLKAEEITRIFSSYIRKFNIAQE